MGFLRILKGTARLNPQGQARGTPQDLGNARGVSELQTPSPSGGFERSPRPLREPPGAGAGKAGWESPIDRWSG